MSWFHGSSQTGLKVLKPHPSRVLGGRSAVFVTDVWDVAISFLVPWTDDDFEMGSVNGDFYLKERKARAFEKFKNRSGSIYTVTGSFQSEFWLAKFESISETPVTVIKETHIENAWIELLNSSFLLMPQQYERIEDLETYNESIAQYRELLRKAIDQNNGYLINYTVAMIEKALGQEKCGPIIEPRPLFPFK